MVSMGEIGHYLHSIVYLDVYVNDQRATTKPINVMMRNSIGWSWSGDDKAPVPPWEWRKAKKDKSKENEE
jgi:hypothetical protein